MGVEFGRREPLVEVEVDRASPGVEAELPIGTVVVFPSAMGVRKEVVGHFLDRLLERQSAFGDLLALPVDPGEYDLCGRNWDGLIR